MVGTRCGCDICADSDASRLKRARRLGLKRTSGGRILMATREPSSLWRARNTAPIPPSARRERTSYLPWVASSTSLGVMSVTTPPR